MAKIAKTKAIVEESTKYYNDNAKPGSLAAKANMVSKYNEKHERGQKVGGFCMDMITVTAKTVDEAVTKALIELETTSDKLEYEVVDKGSTGFLGIGAKPAIIRAQEKESIEDKAMDFLSQIFGAMNMEVNPS